jgi:hypothetical protein
MKTLSHFVGTTILGGVLFLTPIVVLAFVLSKAFEFLNRGLKPMASPTVSPPRRPRRRSLRSSRSPFCASSRAYSPRPTQRSDSCSGSRGPYCRSCRATSI